MQHGRWWFLLGLVLGLVLGGLHQGDAQPGPAELQHLRADVLRLTGEGKYLEALERANALLDLVQNTRGTADPLFVQALSATAMLTWLQGDPQQGELLYRRALHLLETLVGPNDRTLAPLLLSWGTLARDQGQFQQAAQLLTRALSLVTSPGPEAPAESGDIRVALAGVYEDLGHYQQAAQELQQALQLVDADKAQAAPRLLPVLHGLGRVSHALGAWSQAATFLHRALHLHATQTAEYTQIATLLIDLAAVYQEQRDYVQAEALLQRARTRLEERWGAHSVHVVPALYGLARLLLAQGDYASTEVLLVDSVSRMEHAYGKGHPNVALSLFGLATVWSAQARYDTATAAYHRVLAIWERVLGPEHPYVAYALYHLAMLSEHRSLLAEAEPLYHRALHIWQRVLSSAHPLVASAMSHIGQLAEARGNMQQAQQWFTEALMVWQRAFGPDHPDVAIALSGLARVHVWRGEVVQAVALLSQANGMLEKTLYRNLRSGSERQRRLYVTTHLQGNTHRTLSLHFQTAPQHADAARLGFQTVLRRKGMLLETQVATQQLLWRQLDTEGRKLLTSLERFRELRARLALTEAAPQPQAEAEDFPLAEVLDDLIEEHEQALARQTASSQGEVELPTLAAVARRLPEGTLLIEFVTYLPLTASTTLADQAVPPRRYAAYLLHGDGTLHWADLGEAQDIESSVAAMRSALQNPWQQAWQPASQALYQKIIQPLAPWLGTARHLLLSPDGDLHVVPFAALLDAQGIPLIERYTLTYLDTGRDLLRTAPPPPASRPAVIFAGPDFDALSAESASQETLPPLSLSPTDAPKILSKLPPFTALPGAVHEGHVLQQYLPQAIVVTGAAATEARLKAVQGPRLLHLATHGFFLPSQPLAHSPQTSTLASGPQAPRGLNISMDTVQRAVHGQAEANPLLRAGLALAGANRRQGGQEDGVLTAMEAVALDLRGTQLVVLSACDTGLGDIQAGESVYGLRRAFALAGAESQMTTLWKVSDVATQELMVAYYQRLVTGEARSEALRQVQLERLRHHQWSHPFYWAAFIFSGSWGPLFQETSR